jgi:hypothetical protein
MTAAEARAMNGDGPVRSRPAYTRRARCGLPSVSRAVYSRQVLVLCSGMGQSGGTEEATGDWALANARLRATWSDGEGEADREHPATGDVLRACRSGGTGEATEERTPTNARGHDTGVLKHAIAGEKGLVSGKKEERIGELGPEEGRLHRTSRASRPALGQACT